MGKLGYVSITLLPALWHTFGCSGSSQGIPNFAAAYATSAAFIYYFVTNADSVISNVCTANYAVFRHARHSAITIWHILLRLALVGVATAMYYARKNTKIAEPLRWLALWLRIIYHTYITRKHFNPRTLRAIPSVMCGFAVILALIIAFRVLPLSNAADKTCKIYQK